MWVIRGGEADALAGRFVEQGIAAVGFDAVPDAEILTRTQMRPYLAGAGKPAEIDEMVETLSAFVNEIQVGESILLLDPSRDEVVIGEVTSRYQFHGEPEAVQQRHQRTVSWLARHRVDALPEPVRKVAKQRKVLVQDRDATWSGHMAKVRAGEVGRDPQDRGPIVGRSASTRSSTPRAPRVPRTPKPAPIPDRYCPSCHLRTHPSRFRGELCVDCAE